MRRIAPLNALRAFEASARHLSFTRAAEELNVTPAAVSQQVKLLEAYFEVKLFRRLTRALELTESGQSVLPELRGGFDLLARACGRLLERDDERVLRVSVPPSFGARWLVPRLERFHREHPAFEIRIDATDRRADFVTDPVDVALRYGTGDYPGLAVEPLLADIGIPVCSPALRDGAQGLPPLREPADLANHTLLHVDWKEAVESAPSWRMWLRAAGLDAIDATRGPRFTMEEMVVQAAMAGQGVALASAPLVVEDLATGRLVQPFPDAPGQSGRFGYFVVYRPDGFEQSEGGRVPRLGTGGGFFAAPCIAAPCAAVRPTLTLSVLIGVPGNRLRVLPTRCT